MAEVQEQMDRLNAVRRKAEEVDREKSRISGELTTHKKRQEELAQKCKAEFECEVDELPKLASELREHAEDSLKEAEVVLGLREGEVKKVENKKPEPEPEKKSEPEKSEVEQALDEELDEDEDGLM